LSKKLFSNRKHAVKRRRQKDTIERLQPQIITPRNTGNIIRKNCIPNRFHAIDKSRKNYLNYNVSNTTDGMNDTSLSELPVNFSDSVAPQSANTTINSEDNKNLSKSSVKRIRGVNISRVNNIEKPAESGNTWIKPPNYQDANERILPTQHSAAIVRKVNKSAKLNETNNSQNDKSQTIDQEKLRISSKSTSTSKIAPVNVIKIPQTKVDITQRERSSSMGSISVIQLNKSSVKMKPIADQFKTTSLTRNQKRNATSRVTVTKIPKDSAAK
jgi:hypothetical protein